LAESIGERILTMDGSVTDVEPLAVSSNIAAAEIRRSDFDFSGFATEIASTLALTRQSLDHFQIELLPMRSGLSAALEEQLTFKQRQREAVKLIPPRLLATVASIHQQYRRAARAGATARRGSQRMQRHIGRAITSLQVGDSTRQRLEHSGFALGLITAEDDSALASLTCRLQAAQLVNAVQRFDRDVGQITASLLRLVKETVGLQDLALIAHGASAENGDTFLAKLENDVAETLLLLRSFGAAQQKAGSMVGAVSDAAVSLCRHLTAVQSLEADIRIMSLNTTLQCARLGEEGVSLSLIAHELRDYAGEFAKEANALFSEVEHVARIAGSLSDGEDAGTASVVNEIVETMSGSLAALREAARSLGRERAELERDSAHVVSLLQETVANLAQHETFGRAMRAVASQLNALCPRQERDERWSDVTSALGPRAGERLRQMEDAYTMADERQVHDRVLGRAEIALEEAQAETEDVLF
jgi:hypothetical protein